MNPNNAQLRLNCTAITSMATAKQLAGASRTFSLSSNAREKRPHTAATTTGRLQTQIDANRQVPPRGGSTPLLYATGGRKERPARPNWGVSCRDPPGGLVSARYHSLRRRPHWGCVS